MIHFKKPFSFKSKILFGNHEDSSNNCPADKSKINLELSIGSSPNVNENYENVIVDDEEICSKEIVKFSPVPHFEKCNSSQFKEFLSITDLYVKMNFEGMPNLFYKYATKFNNLLHAAMPEIVNENLNLSNHVEIKIKLPTTDDDGTLVEINENRANVPINYQIMHGICDRNLLEYSFTSICSLYRGNLNTLFEEYAAVTEDKRNENNEILLLAECSETPRIAVFVQYKNQSSEFLQVKIFTGGHYIVIRGDSEPIVYHENQTHDLRASAFEYPPFERDLR